MPTGFEWSQSETLALANLRCTRCHGLGLYLDRHGVKQPCKCVLRAIFRACFRRYQYIVTYQDRVSYCWPHVLRHDRNTYVTWGRKNEEYLADFCLVAKRTLDDFHWSVFAEHFLLGGDWRICCRHLRIDRGTFFHAVYRIMEHLGRAYRELQPYCLFPLYDYFSGPQKAHAAIMPSPDTAEACPPKRLSYARNRAASPGRQAFPAIQRGTAAAAPVS